MNIDRGDLREQFNQGNVEDENADNGGDNDDRHSEGSQDGEDEVDEDLDAEMREDILKPASTRSKIVVSLKEPKDASGKTNKFGPNDPIEYELDPYDKVRMRLLVEGEKFYKAYQQTIDEIKDNIRLQPMKRRVNCCLQLSLYSV